ncbi:uncharacterized protein LOC128347936 [Hemicordylus capensis]|uniref:uncharacterized protein LOC128347936 n=1 Tax=Hemicordylus capensis TaxID=884348 RepID=UPI0023036CE1|nr:uncharacterized protein LOC128347936 [Hemicordylus capensis]
MTLSSPLRRGKKTGWAPRSTWPFSAHPSREGIANPPSLTQAGAGTLSWPAVGPPRRDHPECRELTQRPVAEEEGTGDQGRGEPSAPGHAQGGARDHDSIRRLLCENPACALCERMALEAEEEACFWLSAPRPLPASSDLGCSSLPATSVQRDLSTCPRNSSAASPHCGRSQKQDPGAGPTSREALHMAGSRQQRRGVLFQAPQQADSISRGGDAGLRDPHHRQAGCHGRECRGRSLEGRGGEEASLSSSSSTSEVTLTSWTHYSPSPGLSEPSARGPRDHAWASHHRTSLQPEHYEGHVPSENQEDACLSSSSLPKQSVHTPPSSRKASPAMKARPLLSRPGTRQPLGLVFVAVATPFVTDSARVAVEWHLLVKRFQEDGGLPWVLLRSLRAFLPPAPESTFPWPPREDAVVVTRARGLPLMSGAARRRLEQHVKRMVHLKRWGLPGEVQEALRHLKPDAHRPAAERVPASPARREGPGGGKATPRAGRTRRHVLHLTSPAGGDLGLKATPHAQAKLQTPVGKKSAEIGRGQFPNLVANAQETNAPQEREMLLPKLIPPHRGHLQCRSGPSLGLQRKVDSVDMNIKGKYINFLWDLPTLYTQSLAKIIPSAHKLPTTPPWTHPPCEFSPVDKSFLAACESQPLESHLLRKRVQHQWGLPRLAQRSWQWFLPPAPPHAPPRTVSTLSFEVRVEVCPGCGSLPFLPPETKGQLEDHIKSKLAERRWGLPRRVLESLHTFRPRAPPLAMEPRGHKKTSAAPQGKTASRWPLDSGGAILSGRRRQQQPRLQRHVAQKALEIQLELVGPVVQLSHGTDHQDRTPELPKRAPLRLEAQRLRSLELPFVERPVRARIELNIVHKDLTHQWGLPTLCHQSHSCLLKAATLQAPAPAWPGRGSLFSFTAEETPFVGQGVRADLEWHVKRKRLQHAWGLPRLIQRSLHSFLPAPPRRQASGQGQGQVVVLLAGPPWLHPAAIQDLERNVLRRAALQRWRLPRRVLESLRQLGPAYGLWGGGHRSPCCPGRAAPRPPLSSRQPGRMESAAPQKAAQLLLAWGPKSREKLELHLAKKSMEEHLGRPPRLAPGLSRPSAPLPFPKLVLHGHKALQPRERAFSFLHTEHMELAVLRRHLASLGGLGTRHGGACSGLAPGLPAQPVRRPRRALMGFWEMRTSFFRPEEREALEHHLREKRLHHAWGLPFLVQRSLRGFMEEGPIKPARQKTALHVHILRKEPSFLPRDTCSCLERHVHKVKVQRQWGLPRRVLESLRLLCPQAVGAAGMESGPESPRRREVLPCQLPLNRRQPSEALGKIRLCLAKKSLEMQLGLPPAPGAPAPCSPRRQPLPQLIPPGHRFLQPRPGFLPFERTEDLAQMELAVQRRRLASLWGLGPRYTEALGGMMPKPLWPPLRPRRAAGVVFSEVELRCLPEQAREALERHVRSKRLQHEWGLPGLVQRSLTHLVPQAPTRQPLPRTTGCVQPRQQELSFLLVGERKALNRHLQRMKMARQWSLPRKVLSSLRPMGPAPGAAARGGSPPQPLHALPGGSWRKLSASWAWEERGASRTKASPAEGLQPLLTFGAPALEKMQFHLLKKSVEGHMDVSPAAARPSWPEEAQWPLRQQPLPKQTPPGCRVPQPRSSFLPFARAEEVGHLELAILRRHLGSLWGLGRRYVGAARAMEPKGHPCRPPRPRGADGVGFSEKRTLFLQAQARDDLEQHLSRKRLQHEWGLPGLIQRSLNGFTPRAPPHPSPQKVETHVQVLLQELGFLPRSTHRHLEFHLQKMQLQRQWRLPRRVLESTKRLCPHFGRGLSEPQRGGGEEGLPHWPDSGRPPMCSAVSVVNPQGGHWRSPGLLWAAPERPPVLSLLEPKAMERIRFHGAKKSTEVQLEALPPIASLSWGQAHHPSERCLPKAIPPGCREQQPRHAHSALFQAREAEQIEMAICRSHLASRWGLGTRYVGALKQMVPRLPSEHLRPRRTGPKFSEGQTLFLKEEEREALEGHVKRKKVHHEWGLPVLVQKSLTGFMPGSPLLPAPQKTKAHIRILQQELPFLSRDVLSRLDFHVQKMMLQRQWGLPRRVLQSLRLLSPGLGTGVHGPNASRRHEPVWRNVPREPSSGASPITWPVAAAFTKQRRGAICEIQGGPQLLSRLESKMHLHLARKQMEVHLGAPPAVARASWHRALLGAGQALPKAGLAVRAPPQHRRISLSFVPMDNMGRMELAVQCNHFASRWGLGTRDVVAPAGMGPRLPAQFCMGRGADIEFSEVQTPFLWKEDREALELHVKKKRIQHTWGFPRLVQRSLVAFVPMAPSLPTHPLVEINIRVLLQEPLLLPAATWTFLEQHIQRLKCQRQWGLPRRVLGSLKHFLPSSSPARTLLSRREAFATVGAHTRKGEMVHQRRKMTGAFSTGQQNAMQTHLGKKHFELQLEAPPRLVRQSQHTSSRSERGRLPLLISAGQKPPAVRADLSLIVPPDTASELEWNVKRKHLASAWGLLREALVKIHALTPTHQRRLESHIQQREEQETLEDHVKKKRLQHEWNLPSAVQRSLQAFAPSPLVLSHPPQVAEQEIRIRVEEPTFLPTLTWRDLEDSMKRMRIRQQWGLPKRIQDSLSAFSPAAPAVRGQLPHQEEARLSKCMGESLPGHGPAGERIAPQSASPLQETKTGGVQVTDLTICDDEAWDLLEAHIQHKRTSHQWCQPLIVQKSLAAFYPRPTSVPEAPGGAGILSKGPEMAAEGGATGVSGGRAQATKEASASTKAKQTGEERVAGDGIPQEVQEEEGAALESPPSSEEASTTDEGPQAPEEVSSGTETLQTAGERSTETETSEATEGANPVDSSPQATEATDISWPHPTFENLQATEHVGIAGPAGAEHVTSERPHGGGVLTGEDLQDSGNEKEALVSSSESEETDTASEEGNGVAPMAMEERAAGEAPHTTEEEASMDGESSQTVEEVATSSESSRDTEEASIAGSQTTEKCNIFLYRPKRTSLGGLQQNRKSKTLVKTKTKCLKIYSNLQFLKQYFKTELKPSAVNLWSSRPRQATRPLMKWQERLQSEDEGAESESEGGGGSSNIALASKDVFPTWSGHSFTQCPLPVEDQSQFSTEKFRLERALEVSSSNPLLSAGNCSGIPDRRLLSLCLETSGEGEPPSRLFLCLRALTMRKVPSSHVQPKPASGLALILPSAAAGDKAASSSTQQPFGY